LKFCIFEGLPLGGYWRKRLKAFSNFCCQIQKCCCC